MAVNKKLCARCAYWEPLSGTGKRAGGWYCNSLGHTGRSILTANKGLNDPNKCRLFCQAGKRDRQKELEAARLARQAEADAKRAAKAMEPPKEARRKRRRVAELDGQGKVLAIYDDVHRAAAETGISVALVYRSCGEALYRRNRQKKGKRAFAWAEEEKKEGGYANKNGQADKSNHDNGSDGNYI